MMIMRRYLLLCLLLFGITLSGYAQQYVALGEKPDFAKCFDILRKNREVYNQYNDSIFRIKEHDKWVNFFRHRALKNHQIFLANREILSAITDYFEKDPEIQLHAPNYIMPSEETICPNLLPILLLPRWYIVFSKNMIRYCLPKEDASFSSTG